MSKIDVLLGLQWGDEGKGKIVDVLAPNYDVIARFQGGPNAGHTLVFDDKKYVLHCLPSGVFQENTINLIGNGMVLDPIVLAEEIEQVAPSAPSLEDRLVVAAKTHLILPTHKLLDSAYEKKKGKQAIGSTLRGIGPAYTDKVSRHGLRVGDIHAPDFKQKLSSCLDRHYQQLKWLGSEDVVSEEAKQQWLDAIEKLRSIKVVDDSYFLADQLSKGKKVLAEGAQGTLLDISYGSYPYVTSSHTISGGVCTGLGVPPQAIGRVFGVFKAYCTRVGGGPFPSELNDDIGHAIQQKGNEFGATTGRERRCGWLDIVALKYACMINGVDELFMMKGDVLSGQHELQVCTAYTYGETTLQNLPYDMNNDEIKPVYEAIEGWDEEVDTCSDWEALPKNLKDYIGYIEEATSLPISIVSVGPDRTQTIIKGS